MARLNNYETSSSSRVDKRCNIEVLFCFLNILFNITMYNKNNYEAFINVSYLHHLSKTEVVENLLHSISISLLLISLI